MSSLNRRSLLKLVGLTGVGLFSSTGLAASQSDKVDVILKPKHGKKDVAKETIKKGQGKIKKEYDNFDYISISVPENALKGLKNNPNVDSVEKDIQMKLVSNRPEFPGKGNKKSSKETNKSNSTKSSKETTSKNKNKSSNTNSESKKKPSEGEEKNTKTDTKENTQDNKEEEQLEKESTKEEVETTETVSSWGIDRIGAYDISIDGSSASIAVVDTGIDSTHDDLTVQDQRDFTGEGIGDKNGHGTHVAGIIGANGSLVGVAPSSSLYSAKVLNSDGSGSLSDVIAGIDWAMQQEIEVLNISLGTPTDSDLLHETVDEVRNQGHLIISSAGNEGNNQDGSCEEQNILYPSKYDSVVSVSSMNQNENISSFSSVGEGLDIMAPGSSIPSTYLNNEYAKLSGTSMASPHVAGVASLLLDVGYTDPTTIENRMKDTSEIVLDSCSEGTGLVDAKASVGDNTDETTEEEDSTTEEEDSTTEEEDSTTEEEEETKDKEDEEEEDKKDRGENRPNLPDQASQQAKKMISRIFG